MKKSLIALSVALFLTACGGDKPAEAPKTDAASTQSSSAPAQPAPASTAGAVNPQGQTVNVFAATNPPFVTKDDHGTVAGFDIDIINAIAELEGLNLVILPGVWDGALATLDSGESDLVISAVTLNPERAEKYLPTKTYVSTSNAIVVANDSPVQTLEDLKGKTIGVEKGSSIAKDKERFPSSTFKEYDTSYQGLAATVRKEIDAVAGQRLHMQYLVHSNKNIQARFIDLPSTYPDKVFMVKQGNTELVNKLNSGLDKIKSNGTYDQIYQKWFGASN